MDGGCVNSDLEIVTHRIKKSNAYEQQDIADSQKCPAILLKYSLSVYEDED